VEREQLVRPVDRLGRRVCRLARPTIRFVAEPVEKDSVRHPASTTILSDSQT
jgi:hypothetical protein